MGYCIADEVNMIINLNFSKELLRLNIMLVIERSHQFNDKKSLMQSLLCNLIKMSCITSVNLKFLLFTLISFLF